MDTSDGMTNTLQSFFLALSLVESSANDKAFNVKEQALGRYQIRPAYFADAKVNGPFYAVTNETFARAVVIAYAQRYEPRALAQHDYETLARLHNAGPGWRRKVKATNGYWQKVKSKLSVRVK
jgi:hypothetical protein